MHRDSLAAEAERPSLNDPGNFITAIRRRQNNVGRPWLRPQTLMQDLRNRTVFAKAKAQGRPGMEPEKALTPMVAVEGPSRGRATEAVLEALVEQIQTVLGKTLRRMKLQQALKPFGGPW